MMKDSFTRHARAMLRVAALGGATGCAALGWLGARPLLSARAARRWRSTLFRLWARLVIALAGIRVDLCGAPPRGAFLLVANHLSYLDIVVLAAQLDCVFVAKSEVACWPLIGPLGRMIGTIFVDRRRHRSLPVALAAIRRCLAEGAGVVLFAEGTSTAGRAVAPFRSSLLAAAAAEQLPVHYASLSYRTPPAQGDASRVVCWWGEMTFPRHLYELFQLSRCEASLVFGAAPVRAGDRKELARRLWSAVSAQFIPVACGE